MSFDKRIQSSISISEESKRGSYSKTAYLTLFPLLPWGVIRVGRSKSKVWPSSDNLVERLNAFEVIFGLEDLTSTGSANGGTVELDSEVVVLFEDSVLPNPGVESAWGWDLASWFPLRLWPEVFWAKASEAAFSTEAAWEGDWGSFGELEPLGGLVWASLHYKRENEIGREWMRSVQPRDVEEVHSSEEERSHG